MQSNFKKALSFICDVYEAVYKIVDIKLKFKITQSLRWFNSAHKDEPIGAFLKFWIAMEMLTGKNAVTEIKEILSRAYKVECNVISRDFRIGKLSEIRNKIVHEGFLKFFWTVSSPHFYLEALYVDMVFEILGLPCQERTKSLNIEGALFANFIINIDEMHTAAISNTLQ